MNVLREITFMDTTLRDGEQAPVSEHEAQCSKGFVALLVREPAMHNIGNGHE